MKKEKVYIVLTHVHSLKPKSKTEWEVTERVEFVSSLKKRHIQYATAIGEYFEEKMLQGKRVGMDKFDAFMNYVTKKYPKQIAELEAAYPKEKPVEEAELVITDEFGNVRAPTVFDRIA